MQRLRVRFSRGPEVKFISHLDIMRLWQRALQRGGVSLAYSEGYTPHPQISLAAPLPIGVTSQTELMDVSLTGWVSPHVFTSVAGKQLPPGIEILQTYQVASSIPSLQSQVRYAEYEVELKTEKGQKEIEAMLASLLSATNLPWQHRRDTGLRSYDLRALINDLWLIEWRRGCCRIGMRLRCDNNGSGRPEQVTKALGFEDYPQSILRTRLILETK